MLGLQWAARVPIFVVNALGACTEENIDARKMRVTANSYCVIGGWCMRIAVSRVTTQKEACVRDGAQAAGRGRWITPNVAILERGREREREREIDG